MGISDAGEELCYGNMIAIVKTSKWNDHGRVSVLAKNPPDEPDLRGKWYVRFDTEGKDNRWSVLDRDGRIKQKYNARDQNNPPASVNFGDTVTLGMSLSPPASAAISYLSCRDDKRVPPDGTLGPGTVLRRVGIAPDISDRERWTFVDPSAPNSTAAVRFDRPFALKSAFGDYLSQNTYGAYDARKTPEMYDLLRTGPTPGTTETWIVGYPIVAEGKPLRYQDMISVVRRDAGQDNYSHMSAPADPGGDVAFDRSALSDRSRWAIVHGLDATADNPVKFNDTVYLRASSYRDPMRPAPHYLSYRQDQTAADGRGGFRVRVAPGHNPWERWKIVDPDTPGSMGMIRYGDRFALQGLEGGGDYLSSRADVAVTSSSRGETEVWTVGDPVSELKDALPTPQPFDVGPDNSALILKTGQNLARLAVVKGAGMIPQVGSSISGVIDHIWTQEGPDIWDLIKDRVQALVRDMIQDAKLDAFILDLKSLNEEMKAFGAAQSADERRLKLEPLLQTLRAMGNKAVALPNPQQTLPYLVAVATMHLNLLQEKAVKALQYVPDTTPSRILDFRKDLKEAIALYSDAVKARRTAAIQWRKDLAKALPKVTQTDHLRIRDAYIRGYADFYDPLWNRSPPYADTYKQRVGDIFGTQLDAIMVPCLLWPYMDLDCEKMPTRKPAILVTGPYGKGYGGSIDILFWNEPGGAPIAKIGMRAGDEIYMLQVNDCGQHGSPNEPNRSIELREGERIVAAYGRQGWTCNALNLTSNQTVRRKVWGGERDFPNGVDGGGAEGDLWSAVLPAETDPFLVGISGAAGDRLNQLYLHWQYTRWE